jgi:hypothetical protein
MSSCGVARKRACLLAVLITLTGAAVAQEQTSIIPVIKLETTLPLQYSTNSLLASTNARGDTYGSPDFKLSGSWEPIPKIMAFSIYADANTDAYSRVTSADGAQALLGSQLTIQNRKFTYGATYERSNWYNGVFKMRSYTSDDFIAFVGYDLGNENSGLSLTPAFSATFRSADDPAQKQSFYTFKVEYEQKLLIKPWSLVATPKIRLYEFTDSTNKGRQDILVSIFAGIKYALTTEADKKKEMSITTGVRYDHLSSNMPDQKYGNFTVMTSFDMAYTFNPK